MHQFLSRPDRHLSLCGNLRAAVVERAVSGAPAFMRGLRAVFACDFHAVSRTTPEDIRALGDRIRALEPDLILLGGDYSDSAEGALRLFGGIGPLDAPLGCFGVLGNNDREAWPALKPLRRAMSAAGCRLLVNESARIRLAGGTLVLAGLDDAVYGDPRPAGLYPGKPSEICYRIVLFHEPSPVRPAPDLMLCGHTHGGQFNLLGLTPYTIGFERWFGQHRVDVLGVAGWRDADGARVLVSKGIGASRIPLRVGVRPEIELLRFE